MVGAAATRGRPQMHPLDEYASYLKSVYSAKTFPTHTKWPPIVSKKYIHLAVVKKERVSKQEAEKFTKLTIHGNIDDILHMKKPLDFPQVGKKEDGTLAKLILVEGAPGIGKTTFAWKLCRKWAKGKILQEYKLVVLLRLRDKRVREAKTTNDLLYHSNIKLREELSVEVEYCKGKAILFVFEGYDELPGKLQTQQSIFLDILHKDCLPEATVLITSRPSATEYLHMKFRRNISQHIEILGFTKDDIRSYIDSAMEDANMYDEFLQYLKCYPYIRGMMYVPLNAVIVTEVYKTRKQGPENFIPRTMTELYTALTKTLLLRYLHDHEEYGEQQWRLRNYSDLPRDVREQFNEICRIAFHGMIDDELIFDNLPSHFNTLGLMQSVPELYVDDGALYSHNFLHLTLQEYLGAHHITLMPPEEVIGYFTAFMEAQNEEQQRQLLRELGISEFDEEELHNEYHPESPRQLLSPSRTSEAMTPHFPPHQECPTGVELSEYTSNNPTLRGGAQNTAVPTTSVMPKQPHPLSSSATLVGSPSQSVPPSRERGRWEKTLSKPQSHTHAMVPTMTSSDCTKRELGLQHENSTAVEPLEYSSNEDSLIPRSHPPVYASSRPTLRGRAQDTSVPTKLHTHKRPHPFRSSAAIPQQMDPPSLSVGPSKKRKGRDKPLPSGSLKRRPHPPEYTSSRPTFQSTAQSTSKLLTQTQPHSFSSPEAIPQRMDRPSLSVCPNSGRGRVKMIPKSHTHCMMPSMSSSTRSEIVPHPSLGLVSDDPAHEEPAFHLQLQVQTASSRLKNALRFVAGLTKLENISVESLKQLLISHSTSDDQISLDSLHWFFEAQCISTYNTIVGTIQTIHIRPESMTPFDCFVLGYAISHIDCAWEVDLSACTIGDEGVEMLVAGMNYDEEVTTAMSRLSVSLVLASCAITPEGLNHLTEMPEHVAASITELNLIVNEIGGETATHFFSKLYTLRSLKRLNLSLTKLSFKNVKSLSYSLSQADSQQLESLDLSRNELTTESTGWVLNILNHSIALRKLYLRDAHVSMDNLSPLTSALRGRSSLMKLDLDCCKIDADSACEIASALCENSTLERLKMDCNPIGQRGASALAEMLKKNKTLKYLDISRNSVGLEGATAMAEMLKQNQTLEELHLRDDSISLEGARTLVESLQYNTTLKMAIHDSYEFSLPFRELLSTTRSRLSFI